MTNEYFIETSGSVSPVSETATTSTTTVKNLNNNENNSNLMTSNGKMDKLNSNDNNQINDNTSNNNNSNYNNNNNMNTNVNIEYEQIKYNFLKLLKQFKIFEFDKFMKWLEKLVFDYQHIGYNVIGMHKL
jgi:hypothetical protein